MTNDLWLLLRVKYGQNGKQRKRQEYNNHMKEKNYIWPGEAAKLAGVNRATIRTWALRGLIAAIQMPSGRVLIEREAAEHARRPAA